MAYTGYYDAISLGLALKLLIFAMAAALTDSWHPAFTAADLSPNLALIAVSIVVALLLSIVNLVALSLAVFVTEAARRIASVMAGACACFCLLALALFGHNLVGLASPWLLVMLACQLTVLAVHQILILTRRLDDCPQYKLAASVEMLLLCIFCVGLKQWWLVTESATSTTELGRSYGLFDLPPRGASKVVQGCAMLALLVLLALLALCFVAFAVAKKWLAANPLGETVPPYLCAALLCAGLLFTGVAAAAFASATRCSSSMLGAVCLMDSALGVTYQLFSDRTLPLV